VRVFLWMGQMNTDIGGVYAVELLEATMAGIMNV